ncbi:50S ribosomal protein L11 methyltransferase [Eubacteriales bacterium OttesenSCG-928-N13]|nr:50S ribosomal protein L11 methyltransferase [Eubacteriales bacterium OttesenSCG-928-N13]
MDWMQLTVLTTTAGSEIVSDMLIQAGSSGTMIEDRADVQINQRLEGQWDIIDEAIAKNMAEDVRVTGYYPADANIEQLTQQIRTQIDALRAMELGFDLGKLELESVGLQDQDWAEYWKREFKPFRLGEHMLVVPSWTQPDVRPGDHIIRIDPGMAFGTGTHETTALCTALVEQYIHPGDSVIDVGTGTGILAIAAAHMGARGILAIDIDPTAVRVAQQNVRENGMETQIRCEQGDLLETVKQQANVVIANIIADVIIGIVKPVRARILDGGLFICSGIIREKRDEVIAALEQAGYHQLDVRERGEWVAIAARK